MISLALYASRFGHRQPLTDRLQGFGVGLHHQSNNQSIMTATTETRFPRINYQWVGLTRVESNYSDRILPRAKEMGRRRPVVLLQRHFVVETTASPSNSDGRHGNYGLTSLLQDRRLQIAITCSPCTVKRWPE